MRSHAAVFPGVQAHFQYSLETAMKLKFATSAKSFALKPLVLA